jgi:hypothetical protein
MAASVAQKAACPTRLEIQPYSLQQAICPFQNEMEAIAHAEEAHSDKSPKTT